MKKAASFEGCLNTLLGNDFRDDGFSYWTGFLSDWIGFFSDWIGFLSDWISWFLSDLDFRLYLGSFSDWMMWFFSGFIIWDAYTNL